VAITDAPFAEAVHIGKAAKVAGVTVDTIRFYQRLGLIKSAGRSVGGYRLFDEEQIRDLTFVRHAQELGFSLTEIKELLALRPRHHSCSEVQSMLNHNWRLFGRRSTVSPDWKRSLHTRKLLAQMAAPTSEPR
jgi:DNA-binding transcriptional MerR regulator